MPKRWTEDSELVSTMADNLLEALTVFPKRLIRLDELIHQFNMPLSQLQMLVMLSGGDLSISELADRTGIAKPNITPLVDSLNERGMVERVHSTKDRRVVYLHLCEAGVRCVEALHAAVAAQVCAWPTDYSRSEVRELNAALASLVRLGKEN